MAKKNSKTTSRPPIVTIMGHVDHGKTTLLDAIRETKVVEQESGGITQHIGAYQVTHEDQPITFIDTPGHAAFSTMRSRGAGVTDIVVLVVAADDGVMPQTIESIKHIKAADVSVIVAINKIDKQGASSEMVKAQLTEHEIFCEGYGGQVPAVEISALKKEGIDQLLEIIGLVAELEEFTADPKGELNAPIIETAQSKGRGSVATVIVKNGTLQVGDEVYYGQAPVKIRSLINDLGKKVNKATPGQPVQVTGFNTSPQVGINLTDSPQSIEVPESESQEATQQEDDQEQKNINLIIKADAVGSLEAVIQNLPEEAIIKKQAVGDITESDVLLAQTTDSVIIGFNVAVKNAAKELASIENIPIKTFSIIYKLLEFLEEEILLLLEPTLNEETLGKAKVLQVFSIDDDTIAGCEVISGKIKKGPKLHLIRDDKIITDVSIKSLKHGKEDIEVAKAGTECGIAPRQKIDFKTGDVLESYKIKT